MKKIVEQRAIKAAYAQIPQTKYKKETKDAWEVILKSLEYPSLATWSMVEESIAAFPAGKGWDEFSIFIADGDLNNVEISSVIFKETFVAERREFLRVYEEIKNNLSNFTRDQNSYRQNKNGAYFLCVIGILCIFIGGGWLYVNTGLLMTGEKATGTIIANIQKSRGYAPEIHFTVQNTTFILVPTATRNPPQYDIGENVTVYYDPQDPSRAILASLFSMGFGPGMLLLTGIINLAISARQKVRQNLANS